MSDPVSYWLIVEREVIFCGSNFTNAFKNLYASFYVFKLSYPQYLNMFYRFFDEFVFKILPPSPSLSSFCASLESLNVTPDSLSDG